MRERVKYMEEIKEVTKMLSVREAVAEFPGLSQYWIRRLVASGEIPHVTVGRKVLISEKVLHDYVSGNRPSE